MGFDLERIVSDISNGIELADARRPQAINMRSKEPYQPGIGPHSEEKTVELVMKELGSNSTGYERYNLRVPYDDGSRKKCDMCIGVGPDWEWAIEVKMLRFLGDNGKVNDNILMHILSPYPRHRSALTDCEKLVQSSFRGQKGILIYGFDHLDWQLDPAVEAFETLARRIVRLGRRHVSNFKNLIHPVHREGRVFAWRISK